MSARLELRASFQDGLRSRNLPRDQQRQCVRVLEELIGFLSDTPADRWSEADLNRFLTARIPSLNADERRDYNTAVILVHELLARAEQGAVTLFIEGDSGASRGSLQAEAAALALLDDFDDPSALELPPLRGISSTETPRLDLGALSPEPEPSPEASREQAVDLSEPLGELGGGLDLLDPLEPPGGAGGDDDFGLFDPPGEEEGLDLLDPLEAPGGAGGDDFGLLAPPEDGYDLFGEPLDEDAPDGPDPRGLSMLVTRDEEGGALLKDADSTPLRDQLSERDREPDPSPPAATSVSRRAPRSTLPEAWRCERPHVVWPDGRLCVESRYVVDLSGLPDPERLAPPASQALEPAWKMGLFLHRFSAIGVLVLAGLSALMLGLVPTLGALLVVVTIISLAVFGWLVGRIATTVSEEAAESAAAAVERYISAVRVGLYPYARAILAWPGDATSVGLQELRGARSEPLGERFNTAGPAALGVYWEEHVDAFDDEEASPLIARVQRYQDPAGVPLVPLVENDERGLAIFAARGGGRNRYALVPVASIGGAWFVTDGELWLRDGYVEILEHYGARYTRGELDTSGLLELCKRSNITSADVEVAREAGRLGDEAFAALADAL